MARRIVHQLVDDLDGTLLEVGDGETVLFSLDGIAYEIDLSEGNARSLREALSPYVGAGRSVSAARTTTRRSGRSSAAASRDLSDVRAWAKANGHQISERGRVPATILDAYDAAH
ncbi:Lsr2 family protein [Microbacterium sp. X-17]|uniref:histone-like nucleoid-structuring protein Lsr2 n=1 Tax=Microbacterium sp. X-17 TaxID=3144404 RepID=UPI0031F49A9D